MYPLAPMHASSMFSEKKKHIRHKICFNVNFHFRSVFAIAKTQQIQFFQKHFLGECRLIKLSCCEKKKRSTIEGGKNYFKIEK